MPPSTRVVIRALLLALLVSTVWSTSAAAHSDDGIMEVLQADATSPTGIYVEVGLVYANDNDLATEATIMVTASSAEGDVVGPFELPVVEDARYGTTIPVPSAGTWTLAVTSENPVADIAAAVEVPTSLPPSTGSDTSEGTAATGEPADTVATTAGTGAEAEAASGTGATADDGGGSSSAGLIVLVVVLLVVIGGAIILFRGRSNANPA